jgi:hypothetical protein
VQLAAAVSHHMPGYFLDAPSSSLAGILLGSDVAVGSAGVSVGVSVGCVGVSLGVGDGYNDGQMSQRCRDDGLTVG